jgi:hypothetical protein
MLKGMSKLELFDAPPELSVAITEAQVLPRKQNCAQKLPGGKLVLKENSDPSISRITIRLTYQTKDGDRQVSGIFNLSLLP